MSDKGGPDRDVLKTVSKPPPPERKKTLLGLVAPPGLVPPPPPSSAHTQQGFPAPPPPAFAEAARRLEQQQAEEKKAEPKAAPAVDPNAPDYGDGDEDLATEVFSTSDLAARVAGVRTTTPGQPAPPANPPPLPVPPSAPASSAGIRSSAPPKPKAPPPSRRSLPPPSSVPPANLPPPSRPASLHRSDIPVATVSPPSAPPPTLEARPPMGKALEKAEKTAPSQEAPSAPSGADWEEDDRTEIFARNAGADAARKLLGTTVPRTSGVPDAPPPPMSRPSAPVPSPPKTIQRRVPAVAVATIEKEAKSVPPAPAQNRTALIVAAAVVVGLLVALVLYLRPSTGRLDVTVAGPGNLPIDSVQVIVNGKVACETSPCTVNDLAPGTYHVQAKAPGYQDTAARGVPVTGGQGAVHNISMVRTAGTGIRVKAEGTGLKLFVDGREIGPLPQELKDLPPGEHQVKIQGEQFETWEQTVVVVADEIQTIGPLSLKVTKGLAMIKDGGNATDARIVLQSGEDRRSLPTLPINLHIDTAKPHTLTATKDGFEPFSQEVTFPDGQAERTFEITLVALETEDKPEDKAEAKPEDKPVKETPPPRETPRTAPRPAPPTPPKEAVTSGTATLNFNSIPASNVMLNGRPLGRTPKVGVSVSAGKHTVVFVEKDQRVTKGVAVAAGESKTVIHRFE